MNVYKLTYDDNKVVKVRSISPAHARDSFLKIKPDCKIIKTEKINVSSSY